MLLNQVTGFRGIAFTNAAITIIAFVYVIYKCSYYQSRIRKCDLQMQLLPKPHAVNTALGITLTCHNREKTLCGTPLGELHKVRYADFTENKNTI